MRVWFYPVNEPDVYVIVRPNPDVSIICISDGLPMERAIEAAALLATREERDWVRAHAGLPPVSVDPTWQAPSAYWDRSMIPEGLLWEGKVPAYGEHSEAPEREVAGDSPAP